MGDTPATPPAIATASSIEAIKLQQAAVQGLSGKVAEYMAMLEEGKSLSQGQIAVFGAMTAAISQTTTSFQSSSLGIARFTDQVKSALAPLKDNVLGLQTLAAKMGFIGSTAGMTANALTSLITGMAESADAASKTREQYLTLAASSGDLGKINDLVGAGLENLNAIVLEQGRSLSETQKATHLTRVAVEGYYSALGAIPGALTRTIDATDGTSTSMSELTAGLKVAQGTHRVYGDIVADTRTALVDYNLKGKDALIFTTRMSEVSSKFGITLSDVRDHLRGTAEAFKFIGGSAEGATRMVNEYVDALKSTGLSGEASLSVIKDMTDGVTKLSLAQRSFLSAQTGGPGGLMGGYQIEKELKSGSGGVDKVFERVRESLTRQMGKIVTLDEAASSPEAAARRTKQQAMLHSGPLGAIAGGDANKESKLLDALAAKERGSVVVAGLQDKDKLLDDTLKTGTQYAELNNTSLLRIQENTDSLRTIAAFTNMGTLEKMFTAQTGSSTSSDSSAQRDMRAGLKDTSARSAARTGLITSELESAKSTKELKDMSGEYATQIMDDYKKFFKDLPAAVQAPLDHIRSYLKSGNKEDAKKTREAFEAEYEKQMGEAKSLKGDSRSKREKEIEAEKTRFDKAADYLSLTDGDVLESATTRVTSAKPEKSKTSGDTEDHSKHMKVEVSGMCIDCGRKMTGPSHATVTNPGAR